MRLQIAARVTFYVARGLVKFFSIVFNLKPSSIADCCATSPRFSTK